MPLGSTNQRPRQGETYNEVHGYAANDGYVYLCFRYLDPKTEKYRFITIPGTNQLVLDELKVQIRGMDVAASLASLGGDMMVNIRNRARVTKQIEQSERNRPDALNTPPADGPPVVLAPPPAARVRGVIKEPNHA